MYSFVHHETMMLDDFYGFSVKENRVSVLPLVFFSMKFKDYIR